MPRTEKQPALWEFEVRVAFFGNVGAAFMPTWFQAALGYRTRVCVPHTPYTLVLEFVPPTGGVCGAATRAVGGDVGYGLLFC